MVVFDSFFNCMLFIRFVLFEVFWIILGLFDSFFFYLIIFFRFFDCLLVDLMRDVFGVLIIFFFLEIGGDVIWKFMDLIDFLLGGFW